MFVDDDCVLNDGWWKWVEDNKVLEDPTIGEIWGINYDFVDGPLRNPRQEFLKLIGKEPLTLGIEAFKHRGGTHDTIFRRKAIEGVRIPHELHVYEDGWLHHYVICRGCRYAVNPVGVAYYQPLRVKSIKKIIDMVLREQFKEPIVKSFIGLLYPLTSFLLRLYVNARYEGFREGFSRALKERLAKVLIRWRILKLRLKGYRIPDNICTIVEEYCRGGR